MPPRPRPATGLTTCRCCILYLAVHHTASALAAHAHAEQWCQPCCFVGSCAAVSLCGLTLHKGWAGTRSAHSGVVLFPWLLQVDLADSCVLTLTGVWQGQLGWDGWGVNSSSGSAVRELVDSAMDRVRWWAEQCDRMQGEGGMRHLVLT
jgi:hypothetical protein